MASANTLCKKLLNVKTPVVESHDFYTDASGVQHLHIRARRTNGISAATLTVGGNVPKTEPPWPIMCGADLTLAASWWRL